MSILLSGGDIVLSRAFWKFVGVFYDVSLFAGQVLVVRVSSCSFRRVLPNNELSSVLYYFRMTRLAILKDVILKCLFSAYPYSSF